jgi:hypothetical protein
MPSFIALSDVIAFGAGGALIWFFKDQILKLVIGGNALAAKLRAKADKIKAAL